MKLILSVDALGPALSGIGRYTWELAKGVRQVPDIEQARFIRSGRWVDDPAILLRETSQNRTFRLQIPRIAKNWYMRRECRGHLFHAPNFFLPSYIENGVVTVHDLSVFKFPETHPVERVKQFDKSFRQTLDIATHLITDTVTTRQEIIEFFGWPDDQITAIHLGVSSEFSPRSEKDLIPLLQDYGLKPGKYSLCVSTIEPRKRIDNMLKAYARLPAGLLKEHPLVLVGGKGWQSEQLHQLIDKGQEAGWLRYLGFMPEEDLPSLYAGANLFIYPSIYEGFGLPVVEAMASGVPVITSNSSCLPEVAAGAAKLLNPEDLEKFTLIIEEALTDVKWRREAAAKGLQVAVRYNWTECVERTVNVYKTQI